MQARRPVAMFSVAAILGLSMMVGVALPAQAASLWPNGWAPRQFMINVLSSVLAKAGPDSPSKRAVIAADQIYDHSWEALEEQWKMPSKGAPGTYQDYVLQRQEYFAKNNLTSNPAELSHPNNQKKYVKTAKPPATKSMRLVKNLAGIGGGLAGMAAWEYRAEIGNGVAGIVGVDSATGAVCSNSQFLSENGAAPVAGFQNFITGQDCDAWAFAEDWVPNEDAALYTGGADCGALGTVDGFGFTSSAQVVAANPFCRQVSYPYIKNDGTKVRNGTALLQDVKFSGTSGTMSYSVQGIQDAPSGYMQNTAFIYQCLSSDGTQPSGGSFYVGAGNLPLRSGSSSFSCSTGKVAIWAGSHMNGSTYSDSTFYGLAYMSGREMTPLGDGDPDRQLVCTIKGDDGKTYEGVSATFSETDPSMAPAECPALPEGVMPEKVDMGLKTGDSVQPLATEDTTDAYRAWWQAYPECREGACSLDLLQKKDGTVGASCFDDASTADACADWMKDPEKVKNYQCRYGVHDVDLSECYAYGDVFKPEKVAAGQAYTDPETGLPVKGQSTPTAARMALGKAITDPRDFTGCLDKGWSQANPVEWVMVPTQCSLQWAFAPSPNTMTVAGLKMNNAWRNKPPGEIINAVTGWNLTPVGSGCKITAQFAGRPFVIDACPGSTLAGVATISSLISVAGMLFVNIMVMRRLAERSVDL